MELREIEEEVKNCKKCDLYKYRKNVVFGEGNEKSKILLIGEAPGYWEDVKGKPFVGNAGKLLNELLSLANLKREEVYITNVVKCRPPNNRKPLAFEIEQCSYYLEKQIEIINPKVIICLGDVAYSFICNKFKIRKEKISVVHGKVIDLSNLNRILVIIPMYHPAAALHNPKLKEIIREDWKNIGERIKNTL